MGPRSGQTYWIASTADLDPVPTPAVIVALIGILTVTVVTVNVAELVPWAMTTLAGTAAAELLLLKGSEIPPVGAQALIFTVQSAVFPP